MLPQDRINLAEYRKFEGLLFEVQIRTILEHCWAEIEHDRNYKFSGVLPEDMKRRFSLLAATLELADNEFNNISKSIDALREEVSTKTKVGKIDIPIDSISLRQYLTDKFEHLDKLEPNFGVADSSRILIEELNGMGIKTLKDLDDIIPSDFIEKHNKIAIDPDYDNNFLGIVRDILIIKFKELYFKEVWKKSWSWIEIPTADLYREYGIDVDYLAEKYDLPIMPPGLTTAYDF
jgi:putative GTP pyrophosphokinase